MTNLKTNQLQRLLRRGQKCKRFLTLLIEMCQIRKIFYLAHLISLPSLWLNYTATNLSTPQNSNYLLGEKKVSENNSYSFSTGYRSGRTIRVVLPESSAGPHAASAVQLDRRAALSGQGPLPESHLYQTFPGNYRGPDL